MIKRIQCRVISSVPLGKTAGASQYPRISNDKPDRIDEFVVADFQVDSIGPLGWLNITRAPIDATPAGCIFDYYA
jgi:hypothetical protein